MILKRFSLIIFILICNCKILSAQEIVIKKDTAKMYRKIEKYSQKNKFTRFFHALIFEPIAKQKIRKSSFQKIKKINYSKFEGKIIRKIKITTLDPFGYSDVDTTQVATTFLTKTGNSLHLKSKNLAILNLLLIHANQPLDSLLIKDSERLIRSQRFVTGVTSFFELVSQDSVDVSIRVLDSWSLIPDFSSSTSKSNFSLTERNFLGLGHEFSNSYSKSLSTSQNGYSGSYTIPSIYNSFINVNLSYKIDFENNYSKSINIERPFFSPFARWGAGINMGQNFYKSLLLNNIDVKELLGTKYNYQDYWAGHSYQIFKGNSEYNRTTNFITSARYFNKNFVEKPYINQDSLNIYDNEKLYLTSFAISSRKFTQDKYIFNFNITEDVASGFIYNFTTGYQQRFNKFQFYAGARVALGSFFEFGYLSGNLEFGTFLKAGNNNQSTTSLKMVYFTNIQEFGKWKLRQFVKPQVIIGNNRLDNNVDRLTLNGDTGIIGFNSETLFGTKKILLTLQTQVYSPWRILGFRLNPYLSYTAGLLGNKYNGFQYSKLYSQVGLGVIVSNDYLVFSSFQFSISFFPNIPDGFSAFKTNSISTSDFGLQGFEISRPSLVDYR